MTYREVVINKEVSSSNNILIRLHNITRLEPDSAE